MRSLLSVLDGKHILDRRAEHLGDPPRQHERRIVPPLLQIADRLPPHADPLGEILLAVCLLLFKRKIPERYQAAVNTAGFVVLMGFMLLVTFHDVFKLVT